MHYEVRVYGEAADFVVDNIWISSMGESSNRAHLTRLGITHIACIGANLRQHFPTDFVYHSASINDLSNENIIQHLPACLAFIERSQRAGGRILVHCAAGMSRSASVVLAYLIREKQMPYDDALQFLRQKRPVVQPNVGFERQLRAWALEGCPVPVPASRRCNLA
eukprot:TRINITY_DN3668_c0_g1_i1.p1 TRINITY_DN3668_c0_g1~~TRINITY_DN3668_c0_g1_i1.p1  ORF type:complete len:165 (+),score=29.29 TRINITY_DN3668_c0_g1_i1:2-496(+)